MRGLVGLLLTAGLVAAQGQPAGRLTSPATTTQPGSLGWPTQAPPTVPPPLPGGVPTQEYRSPGTPLTQYPSPTDALTGPGPADLGYPPAAPLPGSTADLFAQEYAARRALTVCTVYGDRVSFLPGSLLWEPPLASKIEPRMQILVDSYKNVAGGSYSADPSIGTTVGLVRYEPTGHDWAYQVDLFGVVLPRLSPDTLLATDYRYGIPVTARWGPWQAKLGFEHTSGHLGDGYIRSLALDPTKLTGFSKDEVVFGLGRYLGTDWRVYGTLGYAARQGLPDPDPPLVLADTKSRWRFSGGFEWYDRTPTGWGGTPFVAVNVDFRGDHNFNPDLTAQAGWIVRNPFARLSSFRVFGEYYNGRSPYGQFYLYREHFYGVGASVDF